MSNNAANKNIIKQNGYIVLQFYQFIQKCNQSTDAAFKFKAKFYQFIKIVKFRVKIKKIVLLYWIFFFYELMFVCSLSSNWKCFSLIVVRNCNQTLVVWEDSTTFGFHFTPINDVNITDMDTFESSLCGI